MHVDSQTSEGVADAKFDTQNAGVDVLTKRRYMYLPEVLAVATRHTQTPCDLSDVSVGSGDGRTCVADALTFSVPLFIGKSQ